MLACCVAFSACASKDKLIRPSSNSGQVRGTVAELLTERGFACHAEDDEVQCEAERTYKILIEYRQSPPRLFLFAWFNTNGKTCAQLDALVLAYNKAYPTQATCIEDEKGPSLRFFASTLVPENGITARELEDYLGFWSGFIHDSAYESGLFDQDSKPTPNNNPQGPVTPT